LFLRRHAFACRFATPPPCYAADVAAAALIAADAAAYADMPMPFPLIDADAMPHA
jgi:hypothetical protein